MPAFKNSISELLRQLFGICKIIGDSMSPGFNEGDFVIYMRKLMPWKAYQAQDLVVVDHPRYGIILKRIVEQNAQKQYQLQSDNAKGVSSTELGLCSDESIKGKVIYHARR